MSERANEEFDASCDYYAILGVRSSDSIDDIKKAHIKLALESHPDLKRSLSENEQEEAAARFRKISEAWSVLSKPDVRKSYDHSRATSSLPKGINVNYNYTSTGIATDINSATYASQKAHYQNTMRGGSSHWKDTQSKYKSEQWQNLTLDQKKANRVRAVHTPGGIGAGFLAVGVVAACTLFAAWNSMRNDQVKAKRSYG